MRRPAAAGLLVFGAWTALAVFFATSTSLTYISQDRPGLWPKTLATELGQWWIWAAFTPAILWLSRRAPFARGRIVRALAVHVPLSAIAAFAAVTIEGRVRVWVFGVRPYLLISNLALKFLIYWALVAIAHAVDHYGRSRRRAAEAETRLGRAQLELLRAQLQPHFLFNALNTIAELIHEDPDRADQIVGRLSELLRAALDAGSRPLVSLADELTLARHYLAIQQARFGDRLRVCIDVADGCPAALVPHLCLQPLVENAVKHGLAPRTRGGTLRVTAARRGASLVLAVEDDGVAWEGAPPAAGIGLTNTRQRLHSLYGDAASVALTRSAGVTSAIITLPFSDEAPAGART